MKRNGFSFIEILIYAALLATTGVILTRFATHVIQRTTHANLAAHVLDNARAAMGLISSEIRAANGVYAPTSTFVSHPGQLSLATSRAVPDGDNETYVDFYVDDERLWLKRESQEAALVTSKHVAVQNLTFVHLHQSSDQSAIQINLTLHPREASTQAVAQSSVTLTSTVSLRAY